MSSACLVARLRRRSAPSPAPCLSRQGAVKHVMCHQRYVQLTPFFGIIAVAQLPVQCEVIAEHRLVLVGLEELKDVAHVLRIPAHCEAIGTDERRDGHECGPAYEELLLGGERRCGERTKPRRVDLREDARAELFQVRSELLSIPLSRPAFSFDTRSFHSVSYRVSQAQVCMTIVNRDGG